MSAWDYADWRRWHKFTRTPSYQLFNGIRKSQARVLRMDRYSWMEMFTRFWVVYDRDSIDYGQ